MTSSFIVLHVCVLSALRHSYSGLSCFLMIRSGTLFDGSKGFVLLSEENKNPNPSPIGKKFGFSWFGAPPGTRTLGPLIKRNQHATIVNFQNCADRSFLLFYRKFKFCVFCILCTCYPLSHSLSSRSGVQKCAEGLYGQINHRFPGRV